MKFYYNFQNHILVLINITRQPKQRQEKFILNKVFEIYNFFKIIIIF